MSLHRILRVGIPFPRRLGPGVAALAIVMCGAGGDAAGASAPVVPEPVPVRYGVVDDLAFSPDGRLHAVRNGSLATISGSGRVVPVRKLGRLVYRGALGPGARLVAEFVTDDRASVRVRRRTGGPVLLRAAMPPSRLDVPHAFWSPNGTRLALETEVRRGIRIHDARSGRLIRAVEHVGYLGRQPLSPDGNTLVLGDRRGALLVDVGTGARKLLAVPGGLDRPAWSPDGRQIAGGSRARIACVDVGTGQARTFPVAETWEVAWSPDSRLIAAYGAPERDAWGLSIIDAASGQTRILDRFEQGEERGEIAWSADGARVAYQVAKHGRSSSAAPEFAAVVSDAGALWK